MVAAACTDDDGESSAGAGSGSESGTSRLYVLRGQGAFDGARLSISNPTVAWFSERPARNAGYATPAPLVDAWKSFGFDDDPPNALLVAGPTTHAVELTAPNWDPSASR
jgi:hypothetical protein